MSIVAPAPESTPVPAWHEAMLYRGDRAYVAGVGAFIDEALDRGAPVGVAVPQEKVELLRAHLDGRSGAVRFLDMRSAGANPNRILSVIQQLIDDNDGDQVAFVGEPIWAGRSPAEITEATRHEALINHAFGNDLVQVLCPYDAASLEPATIADAQRTHPRLVEDGRRVASSGFADPTVLWRALGHLPGPPATAERLPVSTSMLGRLRGQARDYAEQVGLGGIRTTDLMIVVTELATNSIRYAATAGSAALWTHGRAVLAQFSDDGVITDPLVGRLAPDVHALGGRGLWLVNQVCDLVQIYSDATGTEIRIRIGTTS